MLKLLLPFWVSIVTECVEMRQYPDEKMIHTSPDLTGSKKQWVALKGRLFRVEILGGGRLAQ